MKPGPIVIIEDDADDQEFLTEVLKDLQVNNEIIFFDNGLLALSYLRTTTKQPFIIFCDINMPQLDGIQVRDEINKDAVLRKKSIPFIFLTTAANKEAINAAYYLSVQGFFQKPDTMTEMKATLKEIIDYWTRCKHPNSILN